MPLPAKARTKPIFKTASPFAETSWPQLSTVHRDNILDLLCTLLQPLGDYRRAHIQPSHGSKRKRRQARDNAPPPPDIGAHILVGLNGVTRYLEACAARNPLAQSAQGQDRHESNLRPLSFILVPHQNPTASLPHAHLPALVHIASTSSPSTEPTRLVAVPPTCEPRLASALHIPHVGVVGVFQDTPGSDSLNNYVRESLQATTCPWIDEAFKANWKGVKVEMHKG